ncbi:MAG: outer membrane protein assembly factor BamD [Pyrinomonadaceae bacterium]
MFLNKSKAIFLSFLIVSGFVFTVSAQNTATPTQRLQIIRQQLDQMRRSVDSAISVLKDDNEGDKAKKDDKSKLETPLGRLKGLDKEISSLSSEVNTLRGKVDRSEKYENTEIEGLEEAYAGLKTRVDAALLETAIARANPASDVGTPREKKKKKKFLWIFGGGDDVYEELIGNITPGRDKELFIVATREIRKNNYEVGRLLFQTIITTYPDSPYLPMAKLAVADSFYLEGSTSSLIQSVAAYQDWLAFFPTHPLSDRVLLKIAEAEMRQIGLPDRDSTHAKKAEARLKSLLQQYPDSALTALVSDRMEEVQDNLGLHNLYIANYYYKQSVDYKKGGLKGAQSRYREILQKYPNFSFMDEALYKLAVTYLIEEETDQAARYFQLIVSDYPNSDYVEKSKEQLNILGAKIPEPKPDRMKVLPPEKKSFIQNFKNQLFGIYPLTIDKNGVLMTKNFDKEKFELIDQIIENEGDLQASQIPKALTTVISVRRPEQPKQDK